MPKREEFKPEELHGGKDWYDDEKAPKSTFKTADDVVDPDSGEDAFIDSLDRKIADEEQVKELEKRLKEEQIWNESQEAIEEAKARNERLASITKTSSKKEEATPEEVLASENTYTRKPVRVQDAELAAAGKKEKNHYPKTTRRKIETFKVAMRPKAYPIDKENLKTMPDRKKQRTFRERISKFLGIQKDTTQEKYTSEDYLDDNMKDAA